MTGEATDALQDSGFAVSGEGEGADDEDGSLCPPPCAMRGGGLHRSRLRLPDREVAPIELWSFERDDESTAVGFVCVREVAKKSLFASLMASEGGEPGGRSTKSAITGLLDLAEAFVASKIVVGLGPEHAGCANLVCTLLYLGFQVVPPRKCPLADAALLLEFDIGPPARIQYLSSDGPDQTCTGSSECSTSAEDSGRCESECLDSD